MLCSRVILEKPTGLQTVKILPAFGNRIFITTSQQPAVLSHSSLCFPIQLNIILTPTPLSSKWSLSLRCPHQNPAWSPVNHTLYMLRLSNYFLFDHPNNISWRIYSYMSTTLPADAQCYVTQCHQHTPDGHPQHQDCITSVYFQSFPSNLGKYKRKVFHNSRLQSSRFMCNKKERSVVLLLLVLLILLLPPPPPPPK